MAPLRFRVCHRRRALAGSIFLLALASSQADAAEPHDPGRQAFARLAELQGVWRGASSKGWTDTSELRLMANGSVLLETSRFTDDVAGTHAMANAFQMDGKDLLVTHYCEAGNAPRLVASAFEEGGKVVTFTFRDGVNLASRDQGHMDKLIVRFKDRDHYSTRWTWSEHGNATWLEDIRYERAETPSNQGESMEMTANALDWFEIPALDFRRAKSFYSAIFDFSMPEIQMGPNTMGFLLHEQGKGVGGAIVKGQDYVPAEKGSLVYLSAGSDLSVVLARVAPAGGRVLVGKTQIAPELGFYALIVDSEGNKVGLHSAR